MTEFHPQGGDERPDGQHVGGGDKSKAGFVALHAAEEVINNEAARIEADSQAIQEAAAEVLSGEAQKIEAALLCVKGSVEERGRLVGPLSPTGAEVRAVEENMWEEVFGLFEGEFNTEKFKKGFEFEFSVDDFKQCAVGVSLFDRRIAPQLDPPGAAEAWSMLVAMYPKLRLVDSLSPSQKRTLRDHLVTALAERDYDRLLFETNKRIDLIRQMDR